MSDFEWEQQQLQLQLQQPLRRRRQQQQHRQQHHHQQHHHQHQDHPQRCEILMQEKSSAQLPLTELSSGPLGHGAVDDWTWSKRNRSKEVVLSGTNFRTVHFHPNWSKGTAGIQGKRPLNNGRYYWELHVSQRVFGTSIMFGIGTKNCRLHANAFRNMLGENEHGWGLSHKGVLWHKGVALLYTKRFRENHPTQIGILFDGIDGTLTYYKDGKCLGVAFRDLDKVTEPLYPIVCSTAAKTEMTLKCARQEFVNLQDRCRAVIMRRLRTFDNVEKLKLPQSIRDYLGEVIDDKEPLRQVDEKEMCMIKYDLHFLNEE